MDFDSCFLECYKAGNPSCQHIKTPLEMQGQGDCQWCLDVGEDEKFWLSLQKEDKFRSKNKSELNLENQESYCDCCKKINKKQDCQLKRGNRNMKIAQNHSNSWSSCYADWDLVNWKTDKCNTFKYKFHEHTLPCDHFSYIKLTETIAELEGKVNFLFQFFKDYGQKLLVKSADEKFSKETSSPVGANDLCNINKRLKAAEEGIVRLTLILENLFKKYDKEKNLFLDTNTLKSQPLNYEEMKIADIIDLLKNRNDLLFSFMKDYLEIGLVEDAHSRPGSGQRSSVLNQQFNKWCSDGEIASKNCNRKNILESLKNFKNDVIEPQEQSQNYYGKNFKCEKKHENLLKHGSKLEVISEQAELTLGNENEILEEDNFNRNTRNLNESFSKVRKTQENNFKFCDATTKLLAQEALLKSSLDKVHFEVSSESGSIEEYLSEDMNANIADENRRKHFHDKLKGSIKTGANCSKHIQNNSCKQSILLNKKADAPQEAKIKSSRKTLNRKNFAVSSTTSKVKQNSCSTPEVNSTSLEKTKKNIKEKEQRPVTAPNVQGKTIRPQSPWKSLLSEKVKNTNLEINNVKNKNKSLLSKKPFVRTS